MFSFSRYSKALAAEVLWLRSQLEKDRERIDRLTEALAKKNDLNIVMPQAPLPVYSTGHIEKEKSSGWFDTKPPVSPVSPRNSAQNSGGNSK